MKSEKQPKQQDKGTKNIIQKKEGGSFVKPVGDMTKFSPPSTSGKQHKSLPSKLQSNMESSFGHDFSNVGIHTNSQKAVQMNARAFTQNEQVHFAPGEFNPNSAGGQNLIGHEFTHIAQQRAGVVKPTKALKKGVMVNEDKSLESEADSFGKKAVRGEAISKYRSAGLGMRSSVRTAQAKSNVVQMAVSTMGGTWDTDNYSLITPSTPEGLRGVYIKLKFQPNNTVNAKKIGLTQSVRSIKKNRVYYVNNDNFYRDRAIKSADAQSISGSIASTDEGTHIDRIKSRNNPIYGSNVMSAGQTLEDTPMDNNSTSDPTRVGSRRVDPTANATYQLGYNYTDTGGSRQSKDAMLSDRPTRNNASINSEHIFETTALALQGAQQGTYYGSIRWGWQTDSKGNFSKLPLSVVSQGVPSSTFLKAAEIWNANKSSTGGDRLDLPVPDVKFISNPMGVNVGLGPVYSRIPFGTRVIVLPGFVNMIQSEVQVVDGPHTGQTGTVLNSDLMDERN